MLTFRVVDAVVSIMSSGVGSPVVAVRSVPPLAFDGDVNRRAVAITTAPLMTILLTDFIAETPFV
jgi:hypothetical protein